MGGMQVSGRGNAPMATVGGQQGPGRGAQQAAGMSAGVMGTQAAEGAELSGGGGADGGKGTGRGRGRGRGGEGGFRMPPGLAGRSYEQLPPGIRKKFAPPQAQQSAPAGGCGMHGGKPEQTAKAEGEPAKPASQVDGATGSSPATAAGKAAPDESTMEQYLRDLASGKVTKEQQPPGFQEWARRQMIEGTGSAPAPHVGSTQQQPAATQSPAPTQA